MKKRYDFSVSESNPYLIKRHLHWWEYGKFLPRHPRWINWVWTRIAGLFWLPCPRCGENFGGHEAGPSTREYPHATEPTFSMVCYRHVAEEELAQLKRLAPLCAEHGSGGGTRSGCPYCRMIQMAAALSRIDYLCGEPNEYECSGYDVHCDEDAVVRHVEQRLAMKPDGTS